MSIASEITDLNNNLSAAKNAVVAKGGTIGDTGLAGLANEIATIPSGSPVGWGSITYLDANNVEQTVTIQNEDEYLSLGNANNPVVTIGGASFNLRSITVVNLGVRAAYSPSNFLYYCNKLREITGVENLIYVEDSFLFNCTELNCNLYFDELIHAGGSFLYRCSKFNGNITIPKIRYIGSSFMNTCSSFDKTLTIPDNFPSTQAGTATYFMYNCKNFTNLVCNSSVVFAAGNQSLSTNDSSASMYVNGVTLTGTYASNWKSALADRTSSPYRKLILG